MRKQAGLARSLRIAFAIIAAAFAFSANAAAQFQTITAPARGTGIVTGQVTLEGQPAAGITVTASTKYDYPGIPPKTVARTKTDSAGRYQLRDLPLGTLVISPQALSFVVSSAADGEPEGAQTSEVSLDEGETLKDINFTLMRGGVITGRITTEDGHPVIAQAVTLSVAPTAGEEGKPGEEARVLLKEAAWTDDRGIYRIFGVAPARYVISSGRDRLQGDTTEYTYGFRNGYYERVYYPATSEAAQAAVIEVTAGSETSNIDIRLGKLLSGFRVSGRISTSNNVPLKQAFVTASRTGGDNEPQVTRYGSTDENGEFTLNGLQAGTYTITSMNISAVSGDSDLVVPEAKFEIVDADVSGLELKATRGLSVSGNIVIENTSNDPLPFRPGDLNLIAAVKGDAAVAEQDSYAQVSSKPDGSFTAVGLKPGRLRFQLWSNIKGLALRSVERGGVVQPSATIGNVFTSGIVTDGGNSREPKGIPLDREHPVRDVTLHVVYGNCRLRGQVLQEDNTPASRASVTITHADGSSFTQEVDSRGRFLFEGLTPGQYEVSALVYGDQHAKKTVTVSNGADSTVTLNAVAAEPGDEEP